jgi:hypothetical protein
MIAFDCTITRNGHAIETWTHERSIEPVARKVEPLIGLRQADMLIEYWEGYDRSEPIRTN